MNKDEVLRRLEERLARGEISERTYLDIKARYDAMPEVPPAPEPPAAPEPPTPPVHARHAEHAGHPTRNGDLDNMINDTVEAAMEQVAAAMESASVSSEDASRRMEHVRQRIEAAVSHAGPLVDMGGKRILVRGFGVVEPGDKRVDEFKAAGACRVNGNLLAGEAHMAGSCVVEGRADCDEFHSSGKTEVKGDVQAQEFRASGKTVIGGALRAKEIVSSGKLVVGGAVEGEDVAISGAAQVGGKIVATDFNGRGEFKVGDSLEAQDIDLRLDGSSHIPHIRGTDIEIRRETRRGDLVADTIEGEDVYLEATRAGLVRGGTVRIGPLCAIHTVEARELEVHEMSTVKERRTAA